MYDASRVHFSNQDTIIDDSEKRKKISHLPLITNLYQTTQTQNKKFRINNPSFVFNDIELYNSDIDNSDDFISLNVDGNDSDNKKLDDQLDTMNPFIDVSKYAFKLNKIKSFDNVSTTSSEYSNLTFDFLKLANSKNLNENILISDNLSVKKRRYKSASPNRYQNADYINVRSKSRFNESTRTKSTILIESSDSDDLTTTNSSSSSSDSEQSDNEQSIDYNYYEKLRLKLLETQENPTKFKRNTFATINTTDFLLYDGVNGDGYNNEYENVMHVPISYSKNTLKKVHNKKNFTINEYLDENLLIEIFSYLSTIDKLNLAFVCKKWYHIVWSKHYQYKLWNRINIDYCHSNADRTSPTKMYHPPSTPSTPSTTMALAFPAFSKVNTISPNNTKKKPNADKLLKFLLNNPRNYPLCICVEYMTIRGNHRLTDKGIDLIASRCSELKYLSLRNCSNIKTNSIVKLILKCTNLKYIDLTGCFNITNVIPQNYEKQYCQSIAATLTTTSIQSILNLHQQQQQQQQLVYFYLQYIDLSDCTNITDLCIKNICKYCVYLKNFYLRRCKLISDMSLLYVAKYCRNLKELSLCQCVKITDVGIKYLSGEFLNATKKIKVSNLNNKIQQQKILLQRYKIKYLSLAKCPLVSDKSLIYLTNLGFFNQIKYLNLRGCVMVTDKFIKYFTGSNSNMVNEINHNKKFALSKLPLQLKSLDVGKCSVTDKSLEYICRLISLVPNVLQRLSLRNLDYITDHGIRLLAQNCKHLQHLNVAKCPKVTSNSLQEIKRNCKSCIIQHTSLTFC